MKSYYATLYNFHVIFTVMYDREANPPTDQILKIVSLGQQGNRVDIQCLGSLFFFSTNLLFAYEKKDGSLHLADDGTKIAIILLNRMHTEEQKSF